jgi:AraC-like DNA-binding protein
VLRGVTAARRARRGGRVLVLAVLRDRQCRARWEEAVRGYGRMGFCDRAAELAPRLVASTGVGAIVVEPRDDSGSSTAPLVGELRGAFPRIPVLAYCDHRRDRSTDILALARAGVHELVFRGVDDVRPALGSALASAARHCTASQLLAQLRDTIPAEALPFVAYCLEHAAEPLTVQGVAAALGVHRKTLVHRCAQARLPSPRTIIAWCRLVMAAHMLEDRGRSVEHVALALDFASGAALRNMLKRHTGFSARELRAAGGGQRVLRRFLALLAAPDTRRPGKAPAATAAAVAPGRDVPKTRLRPRRWRAR